MGHDLDIEHLYAEEEVFFQEQELAYYKAFLLQSHSYSEL